MKNLIHFSSLMDDWSTPEGFSLRYGVFNLDPCATSENSQAPLFFTKEEDGLERSWFGRVWVNPPYGREIGKWMKKSLEEVQNGNAKEVVCLIPSRTDTAWWHDFVVKGEIEFLRGRLKFGNSKNNAPFPSAVVTFRKPNN